MMLYVHTDAAYSELKVGRYGLPWYAAYPKSEPWKYRLRKAKGTRWEQENH